MAFVERELVLGIILLVLDNTYASVSVNKSSSDIQIPNVASNHNPRIIGGEPISITQAPWQVSVRLIQNELFVQGSRHICGGSVITQRVVVTAAHCIANTGVSPAVYRSANEFTLVMGTSYLNIVTPNTLQYYVLQIAVNDNFNLATLIDDIALFFINGYIPLDWPTVAPIPLNLNIEPAGTMCTVTGWGSTANNYISSELRSATVPIVSAAVCSINYELSPSMLCAGYMQTGGVDACQGDSGGPLVCNGFLTGIVSWGHYCAKPGYPGVYTNVSYIYNWIEKANSSFNYSYFKSGNAISISRSKTLSVFMILSNFFCLYVV